MSPYMKYLPPSLALPRWPKRHKTLGTRFPDPFRSFGHVNCSKQVSSASATEISKQKQNKQNG